MVSPSAVLDRITKRHIYFMLIEYVQKKIIVGSKEAGDQVNIEVVVLVW